MSEFTIDLVLKDGHSIIGEADDEVTALDLMDKAFKQYPNSHIRIRRRMMTVSERIPPRTAR
jgi:hypothetical protein